MWRRRRASTLRRNFLKAASTRRSTDGSSEGVPNKTLVLPEPEARKKALQRGQIEEEGCVDHEFSIASSGSMFFGFMSPTAQLKFQQHSRFGVPFIKIFLEQIIYGVGAKDHKLDMLPWVLISILRNGLRISGCSRTDTGVHARGQFKRSPSSLTRQAPTIDFGEETSSSLGVLPQCTSIFLQSGSYLTAAAAADIGYFIVSYISIALRQSVAKLYKYYINEGLRSSPFSTRYVYTMGKHKNRLNLDKMRKAASYLEGIHNFSRFGVLENEIEKRSPIKHLYSLRVDRERAPPSSLSGPWDPLDAKTANSEAPQIVVSCICDAFLWKMMRRIVGTMLQVGLGRLKPNATLEILEEESRCPKGSLWDHPLVFTAPPQGLFLDTIFYSEKELKSAMRRRRDKSATALMKQFLGWASRLLPTACWRQEHIR
eukprot:jgi/Bigna1/78191/fgenesh1_pg.53_\